MTDETDADLVAAVRRGSRASAGRLVERYLRSCRAVALSIVQDVAAAEDVAQDALVYAIERINECRHPDRFGAWLLSIVRNRARNHVRDRKQHRHVELDGLQELSREPTPQQTTEQAQLRERLLAALAGISETHREVVLLHDLEGWTHREIAERLNLPPGTVRSQLHHARKALRERLRDWIEEDR
jgi:RNA polymerase sigma-70 factor (ECF subfamily)